MRHKTLTLEIEVCVLPPTSCFIVVLLFLEVVDLSLGNKIYLLGLGKDHVLPPKKGRMV